MANPLARVVMNNIAQKSGTVSKRPSNMGSVNSSIPNLGKNEAKLLTDLLNSKTPTSTIGSSSSSYNKSTYGRSTHISNASNTMKTLDSLVSKSRHGSNTSTSSNSSKTQSQYQSTKNCVVDKSRPNLKSLCSLDNISVGKANLSRDNNTSNTNREVTNKLNLDELIKGKSSHSSNQSVRRNRNTTYKTNTNTNMMSLSNLAGEKTKNRQDTSSTNTRDNDRTGMITTNNSFVKSKSVINNLEAYVPKITLESIGKKGSLF